MKASKSAQKAPAQEECGVWLDASQLKVKAKRKGVTPRISKMFSPLPGGGGYSSATAFNFTQTKMQMPKTKQSSISTFFRPQHKEVHNKMSTSEAPLVDPVLPSSVSTSTTNASAAPTLEPCGIKRRRETDLDFLDSKAVAAHEEETENIPQEMLQGLAASCTYSQNKSFDLEEETFEEINPPQSKRRSTPTSELSDDSQPVPQAWSQDPLFTYSQYSDDEFYQSTLKIPAKDLNDFFSLQSERNFIDCMGVDVKTSTQKSSEHRDSSHMDVHRENNKFFSSQSPRKHSVLSHFEFLSNQKWMEPKSALPLKHIPVHPWKKLDKEDLDSQFKWIKPNSSPLKKTHQSCREFDEDNLAMLFTQDSEGFRVIAHRDLHAKSPLKDQSNINTRTVRTSAHKTLVDDEENEILFTQDSQGNLVIRH
ncbi:aurora kinase A- and ninein-interacting protein [Antennarius striatus]|uniref:aurora kinase A- and ninein-interacting protein n=1 Tax=Antennarius striatus TaxID=241820 RepID=UPI0035AFF368